MRSVDGWRADVTRHGAQGVLDTASKSTLENEFGTSKEEEVMVKILEQGMIQSSEVCFFFLFYISSPVLFYSRSYFLVRFAVRSLGFRVR